MNTLNLLVRKTLNRKINSDDIIKNIALRFNTMTDLLLENEDSPTLIDSNNLENQ